VERELRAITKNTKREHWKVSDVNAALVIINY